MRQCATEATPQHQSFHSFWRCCMMLLDSLQDIVSDLCMSLCRSRQLSSNMWRTAFLSKASGNHVKMAFGSCGSGVARTLDVFLVGLIRCLGWTNALLQQRSRSIHFFRICMPMTVTHYYTNQWVLEAYCTWHTCTVGTCMPSKGFPGYPRCIPGQTIILESLFLILHHCLWFP